MREKWWVEQIVAFAEDDFGDDTSAGLGGGGGGGTRERDKAPRSCPAGDIV